MPKMFKIFLNNWSKHLMLQANIQFGSIFIEFGYIWISYNFKYCTMLEGLKKRQILYLSRVRSQAIYVGYKDLIYMRALIFKRKKEKKEKRIELFNFT